MTSKKALWGPEGRSVFIFRLTEPRTLPKKGKGGRVAPSLAILSFLLFPLVFLGSRSVEFEKLHIPHPALARRILAAEYAGQV